MPSLILFGDDPVLAQVLKEYAEATRAVTLSAHADADLALFCVNSDESLETALGKARTLKHDHPAQAQLFILEKNVTEPDGDTRELGLAGIFKKPLRLAAVLDAALSAARLATLRTPRALNAAIQFNPLTRTLEDAFRARSVTLTEKEAAFLLALMEAGAAGLTRQHAREHVWGYHHAVESHAVETTVYRLRQKLLPFFDGRDVLISTDGAYKLQRE